MLKLVIRIFCIREFTKLQHNPQKDVVLLIPIKIATTRSLHSFASHITNYKNAIVAFSHEMLTIGLRVKEKILIFKAPLPKNVGIRVQIKFHLLQKFTLTNQCRILQFANRSVDYR